ncbi:LysR family transcriptional regulator [Saccharibacter floricola]|uniref:LysR family transcriptional regulator n=1 Tax=Saccharibacter floricola DSM 15669 TaxID=1123227 RepID=A0ABQ0NYN3_9PROT|nr:LysR family transcriptional regulator [Saccharibacter floricola]GBQ06540.1 LysR family transcriptional regulator [Saccharibacter floricola DSM 15669]
MTLLPDFEAWAIMAQVAEDRSFTRAAEHLSVSRPTVSRAVARLEETLNIALFQRTSRQLSLTAAGEAVLEHARRVLSEGRAAEAALQETAGPPHGRIRITMPVTFGIQHVAPFLPLFMEQYPEITLDIDFSDRAVDVVADGYDVALRVSAMADSSLRARRIATIPCCLVASPDWIAQYGENVHTPRDIEAHMSVLYGAGNVRPSRLTLYRGEEETVTITPRHVRLVSNNAEAFLPLLESGGGVGVMPSFMIHHALEQKRLEIILPQWQAASTALHILTPPNTRRPMRVSVFVEWLARQMKKNCLAKT